MWITCPALHDQSAQCGIPFQVCLSELRSCLENKILSLLNDENRWSIFGLESNCAVSEDVGRYIQNSYVLMRNKLGTNYFLLPTIYVRNSLRIFIHCSVQVCVRVIGKFEQVFCYFTIFAGLILFRQICMTCIQSSIADHVTSSSMPTKVWKPMPIESEQTCLVLCPLLNLLSWKV